MELESLREKLLSRPGTEEDTPFGPEALVYKVMGKMWALVIWEKSPIQINLKCSPADAEHLRAVYPAVIPGYHMNKKHWNTILMDGSLPEDIFWELVDDSYRLVVKGLRKADRDKLKHMEAR